MNLDDPKIITAIIAALSAIIGAVVGAYSKAQSSKQKINELKEDYKNKLQDTYLENAKKYTESIYIPLSISLSNLGYKFQNFRVQTKNTNSIKPKDNLNIAIDEFLSCVSNLSSRGANAFLTTELDEKLLSFCSFLSESKSAESTVLKMIIDFSFSFFDSHYKNQFKKRISGKHIGHLRTPKTSISTIGVGFSYEMNEILAAPIDSEDFEERFQRDCHLINILIKEVTLGARAKHNS